MPEPGYTLSPTDYRDTGLTVNAWKRGQSTRARSHRAQIFQPAPGGKVYQCVFGTRLTAGTAADPDGETGFYEPVAICVCLGNTGGEALHNLSNHAVYTIQQWIDTNGLIQTHGTISRSIFEDSANDQAILDITGDPDELNTPTGLTLLRTRFCQGYVGTGCPVVGNDTEAWYAIGNQIWQAELTEAWIDGTDFATAKIRFNQAAIDDEVATEAEAIEDKICVQVTPEAAVFFAEGAVIPVEFNQQIFFSDDDAYEDVYWHETDDDGFLAVFNLACCPETVRVKNTESTTIPAYGIVLTTSAAATALTSVKRPDTYGCQENALINGPNEIDPSGTKDDGDEGEMQGGAGPFIAAYDSSDGTPAAGERWGPRSGTYLLKKNTGGFIVIGVIDSTNHYVLVKSEPMLTFRGQPTGDVAAAASGTVTIYTGSFGSEASTSVTQANVRNDSSCTVKGSQICTVQYVPDNQGWQFVNGKTS